MTKPLLSVRDLTVAFPRRGMPDMLAADGINFDIRPGEVLGLVGESGSGKTVTSLAVMGLLPRRGVNITGSIKFDGQELTTKTPSQMAKLNGKDLAMVFQDPMTSLNPVLTVGKQISEVLLAHTDMKKAEAKVEAIELLKKVGIPDPAKRFSVYPHQMSGGMRQRALIAVALACKPRLLIADEPTTALDVTIQAQVLDLLTELVHDSGAAMLLITHDLGVVAGMCDRVSVMYGGRIVEEASRETLFAQPRHRYTHGLLQSIPRLDGDQNARLVPIPGSPSDRIRWDQGCAFAPRCVHRTADCLAPNIPLSQEGTAADQWLRCVNPAEVANANSSMTGGTHD